MEFEGGKAAENIGQKAGFVFAYLVFSTMLFLLLILTHRLPASWTCFHILGVTLLIVLIGITIKRLLR
jgi:hypothetical protein